MTNKPTPDVGELRRPESVSELVAQTRQFLRDATADDAPVVIGQAALGIFANLPALLDAVEDQPRKHESAADMRARLGWPATTPEDERRNLEHGLDETDSDCPRGEACGTTWAGDVCDEPGCPTEPDGMTDEALERRVACYIGAIADTTEDEGSAAKRIVAECRAHFSAATAERLRGRTDCHRRDGSHIDRYSPRRPSRGRGGAVAGADSRRRREGRVGAMYWLDNLEQRIREHQARGWEAPIHHEELRSLIAAARVLENVDAYIAGKVRPVS